MLQVGEQHAHVQIELPQPLDLTVVIPCLNEADTLAICIRKAQRAFEEHRINGEIIVADNGSTDESRQIARSLGARVVEVPEQGYGNALDGGIRMANGQWILMADADDSYDFLEIPKFLGPLREGADLVQGCRLPSGGGTVREGAMPLLHRWGGNPIFSLMARWWFHAPIHDVYCGMRAFRRDLYNKLDLRSPGMEYATEMIVKAVRLNAKIAEVPITLHPDGRKSHRPHLRSFRDGWRTLRFFLLCCPRWLFLEPGKWLIILGLIGYAMALPGVQIGGVEFGLHTLVVATLALLCGQQAILFAIAAKTIGIMSGVRERDLRLERLFRIVTLERGLIAAGITLVVGLILIVIAFFQWQSLDFGHLNYDQTMRWVIPGALLTASGFQGILASFFVSILGDPKR